MKVIQYVLKDHNYYYYEALDLNEETEIYGFTFASEKQASTFVATSHLEGIKLCPLTASKIKDLRFVKVIEVKL